MIVFYDGWELAYRPNSPAALHLLDLLWLPGREVQPYLLLPADSFHALPDSVTPISEPMPNTGAARLRWEQRRLPEAARRVGAVCIHLVSTGPALFGRVRSLFSPAVFGMENLFRTTDRPGRGLAFRLREAMAQGGMARSGGLLWPADLGVPDMPAPLVSCAPLAPLAWLDRSGTVADRATLPDDLQLPQTYILYHGPSSEADLQRLLDSWSWAAGSIGEYYPMLLIGLDDNAREYVQSLAVAYGLSGSLMVMPPLPAPLLADLYHACSAVFHPASISPWGGPLRLALAYARPVVALDTPLTDVLVGPAAYLVSACSDPAERARSLGAALISVIVEENLAQSLSRAARLRSQEWDAGRFYGNLLSAYHAIAGKTSQPNQLK